MANSPAEGSPKASSAQFFSCGLARTPLWTELLFGIGAYALPFWATNAGFTHLFCRVLVRECIRISKGDHKNTAASENWIAGCED